MLIRTVTRFVAQGIFKRRRLMPRPGRILVRTGQHVRWDDVVAQAALDAPWTMIDVAHGLGLPARRVTHLIQRKVGDLIAKGDLIAAGPPGFIQRNVVSPTAARILWAGEGRVLLESSEEVFSLQALYPGQICELIGERGVEIECSGALVQGIWGNGYARGGRLRILEGSLKRNLEGQDLDHSMAGQIVLAGTCSQAGVLERAAGLGIAGLILSSMPSKIIPDAREAQMPIVLMQGFGILPWPGPALDVLRNLADGEVILNAAGKDGEYDRPEVFAPSRSNALHEKGTVDTRETWTPFFTPGQRVRVIMAPYMGRVGTIQRITAVPQPLENGLTDYTAEIVLENREPVVVPIANLDVLE